VGVAAIVLVVDAPTQSVLPLMEFYPFRLRPFPVRKSQETKGVRPIRIAEAPKWKSRKGWNGKNRRESPALRVTDNRGEKILVDGGKWMG